MFEVRVPMTSANVACGFDTLGIAFQEYSIFDFELSNRLEFVNFEEEFCNEDNLVYIAFKKALNFLNKTVKGVKISLKKQAPIARGLGSSSTCVVAGIYGAYLLTGSEINKNDILKIATEIEGHPDNDQLRNSLDCNKLPIQIHAILQEFPFFIIGSNSIPHKDSLPFLSFEGNITHPIGNIGAIIRLYIHIRITIIFLRIIPCYNRRFY